MNRFDVEALEAVSEHARRHGLDGTINSVRLANLHIDVGVSPSYELDGTEGKARFKSWAESIGAVQVTDHRDGILSANGHLDDGQPVTVRVVVPRNLSESFPVIYELGEVA